MSFEQALSSFQSPVSVSSIRFAEPRLRTQETENRGRMLDTGI
jgi:hypothetical protein